MAQSKYEYVKGFEIEDALPSDSWIIIRIQRRQLQENPKIHKIEGNDARILALVEDCLKTILREFFDIVCAYGVIDESSFVFHQSSSFFNRRTSKLISVLVSSFTSLYVRRWHLFFPEKKPTWNPVFSGAAYCHTTDAMVRSYLTSQASRRMGAFVFKRKVEEETEIMSEGTDITSNAFWAEHHYILQKKRSKRSIIKARRRGEQQTPVTFSFMNVDLKSLDLELVKRDRYLPSNNWIVVRIDGRGFRKFSDVHGFQKPNDERALELMDECAKAVLEDNPNIVCAYGISDEYSFVIQKSKFHQTSNELISVIVSLFTATYVNCWSKFFPKKELKYAPAFDARAVCYPTNATLRDYLAWRQVDCHINNVNNTCFWKLRELGLTPNIAHTKLMGTRSNEKQELLNDNFHIQYKQLPAKFRKGSLLVRKPEQNIAHYHDCDIIGDQFWREHTYILDDAS